jgi:hypothetical protein
MPDFPSQYKSDAVTKYDLCSLPVDTLLTRRLTSNFSILPVRDPSTPVPYTSESLYTRIAVSWNIAARSAFV